MIEIIFTSLSLVIAVAALFVSISRYQLNARSIMRPAIVFSRKENGIWYLTNVGNGAGINIEVFDGKHDYLWIGRAICNSLAKEESYSIPWVQFAETLGANYTDCDGRKYHTKCYHYQNQIYYGHMNCVLETDFEFDLRTKYS